MRLVVTVLLCILVSPLAACGRCAKDRPHVSAREVRFSTIALKHHVSVALTPKSTFIVIDGKEYSKSPARTEGDALDIYIHKGNEVHITSSHNNFSVSVRALALSAKEPRPKKGAKTVRVGERKVYITPDEYDIDYDYVCYIRGKHHVYLIHWADENQNVSRDYADFIISFRGAQR